MEPKNDDDLEWSDNEDDDHTNNENYWKVRSVPAGRHLKHHHHHHHHHHYYYYYYYYHHYHHQSSTKA